jgi:hypothetical protein
MTVTRLAGPATGGRRTRTRKALLTAHLVTAVGTVGVSVVLAVLGTAGLRGADPATIYPAMHLVAVRVLIPLVIAALVTGVLQALLASYGLLRHGWVTAKLAITVALAAVALLVAVPGLGRAAEAATAGHEVPAAQQIVSTVAPSSALVLLVVAAGLGIFRPGHRVSAGG